MKKKEALAVFNSRTANKLVETDKKMLKDKIRKIADDDEGFENVVFELG